MRILLAVICSSLGAVAGVAVAQDRVGAFTTGVEREPGGTLRHSISTEAIPASVSPTQGATLTWVCVNDTLRVFYTTGVPLRGDGLGAVALTYSFDGHPGRTEEEWWVSSDGQRVVAPAELTEGITAGARNAGVVIVDVHDSADNRRRSHRFMLRDFSVALGHLPCAES